MDPYAPPAPPNPPSRRLIVILAILAVLSTGLAGYSWTQRDAPGSPPLETIDIPGGVRPLANEAPVFSVPTLGGGRFSLSDHFAGSGEPVFLNLWASWCPPCRAEMPAIEAAAARHPDVKFVGVAVQDDFQAAARFATEIGVSYTIGLDEKDEVNALYPSAGLPVTFLIDADGNVVQALYGQLDDSRIDDSLATYLGG